MIKIANHCHYHKALARALIEGIQPFACDDDLTLKIEDDALALCARLGGQNTCFTHALTDQRLLRRAQQKNQSLLKACNNKKHSIKSVCDLTAGWGKDSLILATHGQQVTMVEQNLLIFQCMNFLLKIAQHDHPDTCYERMKLLHDNSLAYIDSRNRGFADCLYLDPMFPAHKSTAKPGKELQLLQRLTENVEVDALFMMALQKGAQRVVVKRPLHAPALEGAKPDIVYREKTIRFDVYLIN